MDSGAGNVLAGMSGRGRLSGYGAVLGLLGLFILVGALAHPRIAIGLSAVLVVALWVAVCRAAGLTDRQRRIGLVIGVAVLVVASAGTAVDDGAFRCAGDLAVAWATAALAVVIARSLMREDEVTLSTIAGLLCLYLLIGMFFAQLYQAVHDVNPDAFVASTGGLDRFGLIYFSFVALTTVGFGDIVPVVNLCRALAATEAVLGQIFLVTVVAAAVSRVVPVRRRG